MMCSDECWPDDDALDETCEKEGLQTGCFRQCDYREGLFWCCKFNLENWDSRTEGSDVLGQACWGKSNPTIQLLQPCLVDDIAVGCIKCATYDLSWQPLAWEFNT